MMGQVVGQQDRLFYEFDLEDVVPADHLLRRIDAVLDLSWLRTDLAAYYSPPASNSANAAMPASASAAR